MIFLFHISGSDGVGVVEQNRACAAHMLFGDPGIHARVPVQGCPVRPALGSLLPAPNQICFSLGFYPLWPPFKSFG